MQLNHLRARVWRMRHFLLALIAIAILGSVLETSASIRPASEKVVVAARDIAAGATLEASDLAVKEVPSGLVPDGALTDTDDAEGEVLAASLPKGMPLPRQLLVSDAFFDAAPAGRDIVPVSAAEDGASKIIKTGDRVAIYAPPQDMNASAEATLVADNAVVVGVAEGSESGSLFGAQTQATLTLFVAVPTETTPRLLGAASRSALLVTAHRSAHPEGQP